MTKSPKIISLDGGDSISSPERVQLDGEPDVWTVLGPDDDVELWKIVSSVRVGIPSPRVQGNCDANTEPGITMLVRGAVAQKFLAKEDLFGGFLVQVDQISPDLYRVTLPLGTYSMSFGGCQIMVQPPKKDSNPDENARLYYVGCSYADVVRVDAYNSGEKWQNENLDETGNPKG